MMRLIPPVDHDRDILGNRGRDADILLDHENGDVAFRAEPDQHLLDLGDNHRREALGRLVHDEEFGIGHERAPDRQHLLLAAGKLAAAVALALGQSREGVVNALDRPGARLTGRNHAQVLVDRQRPPEAPALRHVADAVPGDLRRRQAEQVPTLHAHGAAGRFHQTHDRLAERRLAHAVAADDRKHAVLEREVDALERMRPSVIDVEPFHLQNGAGLGASRLSHGRLPGRGPAPQGPTRSPAANPP